MKDVRRLYVNTADGGKLGYLNLATLDAVPESAATEESLLSAIRALSPGDQGPVQAPQQAPAPASAAPEAVLAPQSWEDLADTPPAYRLAGLDDASYKAGAAGEQRTAGILAGLERSGHRVLHSLPLSPRKDIDHLVIGPSGVVCINTKTSTYEVSAKPDGTVVSDGYKQSWLESISRDADLAASYLSTAARMEITCVPVIAVWSSIGLVSGHGRVVDAADIAERIRSRPARYSPAWVDVVHATARRSDTWTAHH